MDITTKQVWSALPYAVRECMAKEAGLGEDSHWYLARIEVTPWTLLTDDIRSALHSVTTCQDME